MILKKKQLGKVLVLVMMSSCLAACGTQVLPCPFVLDEGNGFRVSLPCGLTQIAPEDYGLVRMPGATYQMFFLDDTTFELFQFVVRPVNTLSTSTDLLEGVRYDGLVNNAHGDTLLKSTNRGEHGEETKGVIGLLADGAVVLGLTNASLKFLTLLDSIELVDTDGSGLIQLLEQGLPTILVAPSGGVLTLDDQTSWRVQTSAAFMTHNWAVGDKVFVSGAKRFGGTFFLTNSRDFVSVHADFVPSP